MSKRQHEHDEEGEPHELIHEAMRQLRDEDIDDLRRFQRAYLADKPCKNCGAKQGCE